MTKKEDSMNRKMNEPIDNISPHYTNPRFKTARTVWGAEEEGLSYDYSDRLWEWDYDKAKAASQSASATAKRGTAQWFQDYLSAYYGEPVELCYIMAGFNLGNGYPYQVFGYRFAEWEAAR